MNLIIKLNPKSVKPEKDSFYFVIYEEPLFFKKGKINKELIDIALFEDNKWYSIAEFREIDINFQWFLFSD